MTPQWCFTGSRICIIRSHTTQLHGLNDIRSRECNSVCLVELEQSRVALYTLSCNRSNINCSLCINIQMQWIYILKKSLHPQVKTAGFYEVQKNQIEKNQFRSFSTFRCDGAIKRIQGKYKYNQGKTKLSITCLHKSAQLLSIIQSRLYLKVFSVSSDG